MEIESKTPPASGYGVPKPDHVDGNNSAETQVRDEADVSFKALWAFGRIRILSHVMILKQDKRDTLSARANDLFNVGPDLQDALTALDWNSADADVRLAQDEISEARRQLNNARARRTREFRELWNTAAPGAGQAFSGLAIAYFTGPARRLGSPEAGKNPTGQPHTVACHGIAVQLGSLEADQFSSGLGAVVSGAEAQLGSLGTGEVSSGPAVFGPGKNPAEPQGQDETVVSCKRQRSSNRIQYLSCALEFKKRARNALRDKADKTFMMDPPGDSWFIDADRFVFAREEVSEARWQLRLERARRWRE